MSLTSLANAPLLSGGLPLTKSRSRPAPTIKEDQAAIDALFQDGHGVETGTSNAETKCSSPLRELAKSLEPDVRKGKGDADTQPQNVVSLPTISPLNQLNADLSKRAQLKQDDCLFAKTRDANDVLSRFLADNASDKSSNKNIHSEEEKTSQRFAGDNGGAKGSNKSSHFEEEKACPREEFKAKWNSYSALPLKQLPTSANSPRLSLGSTLRDSVEPPSPSLTKTDFLQRASPQKLKDEIIEDILSLLPDESRELSTEVSMIGSARAATSTLNTDDENLDFGGYQPSCLSMQALNSSIQKRSVANFLLPSEKFVTQGNKTDMVGKEHPSCVSMDTILDQSFQQTRSLCNKDEKLRLNDEHKRNTLQAQDSPTDKASVNSCSVIVSKGNNEGLALEVQRLKEENLALREEIMKIESEKLTIEKEILEKELSFEPEAAKQATMDSREAQQIADKLALELLSVKQSLLLTEEKIESMKAVHQKEVELLKHMHAVEVEARDKQLHMESALVAENKSAMEAFGQLVHKADEWSSKIDQLYKNLVSEREAPPTEKLSWLANIGSTVSEHESSLLVLDKRSSEVCSQLENVAANLYNVRKDMDRIQKHEESKGYEHLQACQVYSNHRKLHETVNFIET